MPRLLKRPHGVLVAVLALVVAGFLRLVSFGAAGRYGYRISVQTPELTSAHLLGLYFRQSGHSKHGLCNVAAPNKSVLTSFLHLDEFPGLLPSSPVNYSLSPAVLVQSKKDGSSTVSPLVCDEGGGDSDTTDGEDEIGEDDLD